MSYCPHCGEALFVRYDATIKRVIISYEPEMVT